jgi:hypothetical protein
VSTLHSKDLPSRVRNQAAAALVAEILQNYANRGVFRSYTRAADIGGKAVFKMIWHHDRPLEMVMDRAKKTLRFPVLLPGFTSDSAMYARFKEFLESRHSEDVPEHRRIDPTRARARCTKKGGDVTLTLSVEDGDYEYSTRKMIHLVDEIFKNFLGDYYEYQVEHLGLDPDRY